MSVLGRIRSSFNAGVERLRRISELLNERVRVEMAVLKVTAKSEKLRERRDEIARAVGEKVYEAKGHMGALENDEYIKAAVFELESIDGELAGLAERACQACKESRTA